MLNKQKIQLLKCLIDNKDVSIDELSILLNLKHRMIYEYINNLNWLLKTNQLCLIEVKDKICNLKLSIEDFELLISKTDYLFSQEERINFICFDVIVFQNLRVIDNYCELFKLSKNTIAQDFIKLKKRLQTYQLKLDFNKEFKYSIKGNSENKRKLVIDYIWNYIMVNDQIINNKLFDLSQIKNQDVFDCVVNINNKIGKKYSKKYLEFLELYLSTLKIYYQKNEFISIDDNDKKVLVNVNEYKYSKQLIKILIDSKQYKSYCDEEYYLTILLTSGNVIKSSYHDSDYFKNLNSIILTFLLEIEKNEYLFFFDKDSLMQDLINHLIPVYYRTRFNLKFNIDYIDVVKEKYKKMFNITKKHIHIIENFWNIKFNNDEIALLSLYIVSNVEGTNTYNNKVSAILVTNEGLSVYRILQMELENIFANLEIINILNDDEFLKYEKFNHNYDLILSSIHLTNVDYVKINNILTNKNKKEISEKIQLILNKRASENINLEKVLLKEHINLFDLKNLDWIAATRLCCQPLIETNHINKFYVDAIINNISNFNAVIHLSDNIAMLHASFKDGVNKLGFSINFFKTNVNFPSKKKFNTTIIVVLAPIDNEKHIQPMLELISFLKDNKHIEKIKKLKDANSIYEYLMKQKDK